MTTTPVMTIKDDKRIWRWWL